MTSRLYSPQNDPDAWVYQQRSLEANTTYTYSVYARAYSNNASGAGDQSTTTSDTFRFVIQDTANPDGNNYVTRFNQAHKSEELQLTDKFKRYSFTFTTSPTSGNTWVGIHPPYGSDAQGGLFWGHQLEKRASPSTYIYTYSGWDFNSPQVSLGEGYTQWANNYPNTNYSLDSEYKIDLVNDTLASKEMYIGRYYFDKKKWIPAINRFRTVIDDYETTIYAQEALHRLVEVHYILGLKDEAKKYAKLLGYNYQSSKWYEKSYSVFDKEYKENVKKRDKKRSKKNKTLKKIKSLFSLDG